MKVVNCVHCGTPNFIQERGGVAARCIKCGNYVELSTSLLDLLPTWAIWTFAIVGIIFTLGLLPFLYFICN